MIILSSEGNLKKTVMQFLYSIPPNLDLPQDAIIMGFSICIKHVAFMEINLNMQDLLFRCKWWGHQAPTNRAEQYLQMMKKQQEYVHPVAVSKEMFLRYCTDMKGVEIQIHNEHLKCLGKSVFNFAMHQSWKGEFLATTLNIKNQTNKKIGELFVELSIKEIANPGHQPRRGSAITSQKPIRSRHLMVEAKETSSMGSELKKSRKKSSFDQRSSIIQHSVEDNEQLVNVRDYITNNWKVHNQIQMRECFKCGVSHPMITENTESCACYLINGVNYHRQKMKLEEEYDIIFPKKHKECLIQNIELEFVKFQSVERRSVAAPLRIKIPIFNQENTVNEYYFPEGCGIIKFGVSIEKNEKEIEKFLKKAEVQIEVGQKGKGSIGLYKLIGSNGVPVPIAVCETKQKREILKGHYLVKLIKEQVPQKNIKQEVRVNEIKLEGDNQYIWVYLQDIHLINKRGYENANMFLRMKVGSEQIISRTIWGEAKPNFNETVSFRTPSNSNLVIEILNKQEIEEHIGKGLIDLTQISSLMVDEYIEVKQRQKVLGYLRVCIGKGSLSDAHKLMRNHQRWKPSVERQKKEEVRDTQRKQRQKPEKKDDQSDENGQKEIEQIFSDKKSSKRESSRRQQLEQQREQSEEEDSMRREDDEKQKGQKGGKLERLNNSDKKDILDIHNTVFHNLVNKEEEEAEEFFEESWLRVTELENLVAKGYGSQLASIYLNTGKNRVDMKEMKESFEAYKVYHYYLVHERDEALSTFVEGLEIEGISINEVEMSVEKKIRSRSVPLRIREAAMWKQLKEIIDDLIIQKVRYFYEGKSIEFLCDSVRKFELFQTTQAQPISTMTLKHNIQKEVAEMLGLQYIPENFQQQLTSNAISLSQWQKLNLCHQAKTEMQPLVKSPTFGVLPTERAAEKKISPAPIIHQQSKQESSQWNPSIEGLSPIAKKQLKVTLSSMDRQPISITINQHSYPISQPLQKGKLTVNLPCPLRVRYSGELLFDDEERLDFEGSHREWISLLDEEGTYRGCIQFNQ